MQRCAYNKPEKESLSTFKKTEKAKPESLRMDLKGRQSD